MPSWWWILPALAGLLAVGLLAGGISAVARRRPYWAAGELLTGGTLLALAAVILLLGLDIQTFSRLTYERPVATLALHRTGDNQFEATLAQEDTVTPSFALGAAYTPPASKTYPLSGDEWRVEARVLKWKPWANMLGLDALYRLDRLSGEYADTAQEQTAPRSAYDLRPANGSGGLGAVSARLHRARLVDTVYGSAALMPMADGAQYSLAMTQTGLVARPANDQAVQAVGGWK
ncbi:MAG TPA: hypothetical protein VH722_03350 [Alphaproteobacteria bacterium]|nr:hypothetical protein [Alphaproteobacteria bacterium]